MEPLLVHPDPPPPDLARLLDLGGYGWKPVADERQAITDTPDDGWGGAIVVIGEESEAAWALCRAIRIANPRRENRPGEVECSLHGFALGPCADRFRQLAAHREIPVALTHELFHQPVEPAQTLFDKFQRNAR